MKRIVVLAIAVSLVVPATTLLAAEGGQAAFEANKCNMCHAVPPAGVEAKAKSEKMKGPDLVDLDYEAEWLSQYIKQEVQLEGADHKKEYKGTDEDLAVMVDWLLEQKS